MKITTKQIEIDAGDLRVVIYCDADGVPEQVYRARYYGDVEHRTRRSQQDLSMEIISLSISAEHLERIAAIVSRIRRDAEDYPRRDLCMDHGYWLGTQDNGYRCPLCAAADVTPEQPDGAR